MGMTSEKYQRSVTPLARWQQHPLQPALRLGKLNTSNCILTRQGEEGIEQFLISQLACQEGRRTEFG